MQRPYGSEKHGLSWELHVLMQLSTERKKEGEESRMKLKSEGWVDRSQAHKEWGFISSVQSHELRESFTLSSSH